MKYQQEKIKDPWKYDESRPMIVWDLLNLAHSSKNNSKLDASSNLKKKDKRSNPFCTLHNLCKNNLFKIVINIQYVVWFFH